MSNEEKLEAQRKLDFLRRHSLIGEKEVRAIQERINKGERVK